MISVADLWYSRDQHDWNRALESYWTFVRPENLSLERALNSLSLERLQDFDAVEWYDFLHDEYFRWKYTAKNRYATTTSQLKRYLSGGDLSSLDDIRRALLSIDCCDIKGALGTARSIRGLGISGASGLLSLMYPSSFATVDQFVVKAIRLIPGLAEADALVRMNPVNLTIANGVLLTQILRRKANDNNRAFSTTLWSPRKIDMVLWALGH